MAKDKIVIPNGTVRSKVEYLLDNHPELTRLEMAEILDKGVGSIYSYVHDIKKTRERAEKKKKSPTPKPVAEPVQEKFEIEEEIAEEIFEQPVPEATEKLEPVPSEPTVIEWVEPKASSKVPSTVDFSLTGVSGENLQTLLFNLLSNSLSNDGEYSFVLRLEKTK